MMNSSPSRFKVNFLTGLCAICFVQTSQLSAQEIGPPPPPLPNQVVPQQDVVPQMVQQPVQDADIQAAVLTRGPVHEAYAEQYTADPGVGIAVDRQPPDPIEELPPEEMPDGTNVEWIPGYWAWDEDIADFIWISGLWRDIPIGQRWVPGYWANAETSYRWVPGFWIASDAEELTYLPEPPQTLEQGPNIASPSQDHFWVPGNWVYQTNNYAWQPGYWSQPYNDNLWMPSRYQWTPRGYVYCSGYWDYPMSRRGVLFSPVHFQNRRIPDRYYGYRYRPRLIVATGPLLVHLFVRPSYRHYYFGDYYAARYRDRGIYPFTQLNTYSRRGYAYDPLRIYYQQSARRNTYNRLVDWNHYFDRNEALRPPRTYAQTQIFVSDRSVNRNTVVIQQATLSESMTNLAKIGRADTRTFHKISISDRDRISNRASSAIRQITQERSRFEALERHGHEDRSVTNAITNNRGSIPNVNGQNSGPNREERGKASRAGISDSFRLPEVTAMRDRIDGRDRDRRNGDARNGDARNGDARNGDARSLADSLRDSTDRFDNRSGSDRRTPNVNAIIPNSQRNDQSNSAPGAEPNHDRTRASTRYSPSDLRERIEAARKGDLSQLSGNRSNFNNQTTRSDVTNQPRGKASPSQNRGAEIRDGGAATRPGFTDRGRGDFGSAGENQRDQRNPATTGRENSRGPSNSASDLQQRIEAARRAIDANHRGIANPQANSPTPDSNRRTENPPNDRGTQQRDLSAEIRARIEAARGASESQRGKGEPATRDQRSNRESHSNDQRERLSTPPIAGNSRQVESPGNDIRSRIEAARKASEDQRTKSNNERPAPLTRESRPQPEQRSPGRTESNPPSRTRESGSKQTDSRSTEVRSSIQNAIERPKSAPPAAKVEAPRSRPEPKAAVSARPATTRPSRPEPTPQASTGTKRSKPDRGSKKK